MFTEHKSVFLFVDCLWSRAPGRASLLIQEEEVKGGGVWVQSADSRKDRIPAAVWRVWAGGKLLPVLENSERGFRNELGNGALGTFQLFLSVLVRKCLACFLCVSARTPPRLWGRAEERCRVTFLALCRGERLGAGASLVGCGAVAGEAKAKANPRRTLTAVTAEETIGRHGCRHTATTASRGAGHAASTTRLFASFNNICGGKLILKNCLFVWQLTKLDVDGFLTCVTPSFWQGLPAGGWRGESPLSCSVSF